MVDVWDVASPGIRTRNALHSTTLRLPWHRTQPASAVDRAFAEQYERHHQAIYRYCRSILRHDQDAQDALQATMLKALAAMQAGTVTGDLRPWLFRVAHNESISMRRRHANEAPLEAAGELGADHLHQRVDDRAALARLQSDLEDLADRQRTALVLREFSGLGHEEIAQVLGSTPGAVKQTIFEARKALLECETGRSMTCDEIQRLLSDQDGRTLRSRKLRAHLRDCVACTAFSAAMHDRPRQLALLAPAIPAATGAGILANVVGGGHAAAGSAAAAGGTGAAAAASGAAGTSVAAGTGAAASTIATSAGLKVAALLAAGGIAAGGGVAVKEHRSAPTAPPTTTQSAPASPAGAPSTAMPGAGGATADPAAKRSGAGSPPQATTPDGAGVAGEAKGAAEAGGAGAATGPGDSDPGASAGAPGRATSSAAKSNARGTTTSASAKTKRSGTKAHAKTKSSAKPTTKGKTPKPAAATSGGAPGTDKTKPAGNSGGSSGAGGSSGTSGSSGSTAPAESGSAGGAATPPERAPAPKDPAAGGGANGSGSGPSNRSGAETPGEPQG